MKGAVPTDRPLPYSLRAALILATFHFITRSYNHYPHLLISLPWAIAIHTRIQ